MNRFAPNHHIPVFPTRSKSFQESQKEHEGDADDVFISDDQPAGNIFQKKSSYDWIIIVMAVIIIILVLAVIWLVLSNNDEPVPEKQVSPQFMRHPPQSYYQPAALQQYQPAPQQPTQQQYQPTQQQYQQPPSPQQYQPASQQQQPFHEENLPTKDELVSAINDLDNRKSYQDVVDDEIDDEEADDTGVIDDGDLKL